MTCVWKLVWLVLIGVGAFAWLGPGAPPLGAAPLQVGEAAPNFTLPGSDGRTYTLTQFRGKRAVVLAWFPKAFTGG